MKISVKIREEINKDIERCRQQTTKNGSGALFNELVAKYSVLDSNFKNNLQTNGKIAGLGEEFDYRNELNAIASKLEMYLILDDDKSQKQSEQHSALSNSANDLLKEIFNHLTDNGMGDTSYWEKRFSNLSYADDTRLRSVFSELIDKKMISVKWGDNIPYYLVPLNNAFEFISKNKNDYNSKKMDKETYMENKEYDVFISHANQDKLDYIDSLYDSINGLGINVFYDKTAIGWGDNWKKKILDGVDKSEFAIIVISNNFFGREWTEKELDLFLNRQNRMGEKIILPLLYGVGVDQMKNHYPTLGEIQAISTSDHTKEQITILLAQQLIKRYKSID